MEFRRVLFRSLDGEASPDRERGERGGEASLGERAWVNALSEVMERCPGASHLLLDVGEHGLGRAVCARSRLRDKPCDESEAVLGAVAQLPLEAAALGVRGLDDPAA